MAPSFRVRFALLMSAIAVVTLPASGWTWGFGTHHYIAQNYSQHLPAAMDGLQAYDAQVDLHVTDPDSRKSATPGENVRHYIDIDYYPEFFAGTLPHDRTQLEALYTPQIVYNTGVLPWAVGEVVATLTQQFQNGQWSLVATTIADLCHYVGDAHQPLHCTKNYDGKDTQNDGIHLRYESTMMNDHLGELVTPPMTVVYYPNVVDAMFDLITTSWGGVATILQADDDAKVASGGSTTSTTYKNVLWAETETMTRAQVNAATLATASFVYTAWVNAGYPPVPGSTAGVGDAPAAVRLSAGPSPFRGALSIRYSGAGPFDVDVYDVRGARIERLARDVSGSGAVSWRPAAGVGSGIYFVRLSGPGVNVVRRVTRLE